MRGLSQTRRHSPLGRAGYHSVTPTHDLGSLGATEKYKFLPRIDFNTQNLLKEMFSTELKYAKTRQTGAYGSSFAQLNVLENYGFNNRPGQKARIQIKPKVVKSIEETPIKVLKTHVRNKTFDPILGCEKEFETPKAKFTSLGTNLGDSYKLNAVFRQSAPSNFQLTLRS